MATMNARHYNEVVAKGHFRKVYPFLAEQVVACTGIRHGRCIDLGGGPGLFGIELASITQLQVTVLDPNPDCIEIAQENIVARRLTERVCTRLGSAEDTGLENASVELVISRGSIHFWQDQTQGLCEILRVLKPGGWAYVGCGMGSAELAREVEESRRSDPGWNAKSQRQRMERNPPQHFRQLLDQLGIDGIVEASPAGIWIIFQKGQHHGNH